MTHIIPEQIDIDLSTQCNLKCRFCHVLYYTTKEAPFISYNDFRKLDSILPLLKSITLFSKFEPLMCPDITKILEHTFQYPLETYFSTNGLLLTEHLLDLIVGKLTYLTVSITGFSPSEYHLNMGADGFEKITGILNRLQELKKSVGTDLPLLRISTVGMISTIEKLPGAIDYVKSIGAEEGLQVTSLRAHTASYVEELPLHNETRFNDYVLKARDYAKEQGVKLFFQGGDSVENERNTKKLGHTFCHMPWQRMSLQPGGNIYPCSVSNHVLGNFLETDILDIWNGPEMRKFRDSVNNPENMNKSCFNCTHCRHGAILTENTVDYSASGTYLNMTRKKVL